MNSIATIVEFQRLRKVCFYTIKFEDSNLSEAEKFFEKVENEQEYEESVNNLVDWIIEIGNIRGARFDLFRDERLASALPPPRNKLNRNNFVKDIRLYCFWISPSIVVLFNGGIKTEINPAKCPNVSMHFHNSNTWVKQLQEYDIETNGRDILDLETIEIYE